jgi:hypothetical protein
MTMNSVKSQKRPSSFMKRAIIVTCFLLIVGIVIMIVKHYEAPQQDLPTGEPSRKHELQEADRRFLIEQGLQNPINDLVQDLMKHNELIPCKGAVGGTPGFYDPTGIAVLSKNRVIADYDDGHVEGTVELTFTVTNGVISWRVVQADCEAKL